MQVGIDVVGIDVLKGLNIVAGVACKFIAPINMDLPRIKEA